MEKTPPTTGTHNKTNNNQETGEVIGNPTCTLLVMPGQRWVEEFHRDLKEGDIEMGVFAYCRRSENGKDLERCLRIVGGEHAIYLSGLALWASTYLLTHGKVLHSEEITEELP